MSTTAEPPTPAGTQLSEQDLNDIVNGACLFGSGGGGPRSLGETLVQAIVKDGRPVILADPAAMPGTDLTAVSAGVGSPDAASSGFPVAAAGQAFRALEAADEQVFTYVLPGEVGAANSIVPMTTAATRGTPVLDAAGSPRAMPQFEQATFAIHDAPIGTIALANDTVQVSFAGGKPADADSLVRAVVSTQGLFTEDAGIAFWSMDGATMQKVSLSGTTTRARDLGAALRTAPAGQQAQAVCDFLGGRVLSTGTITATQEQTGGGFDVGYVTVTDKAGRTLQILNQNENLLAWFEDSAAPVVMAPDLIAFMTADGQPFSLADPQNAKGTEIVVIAAPSPAGYNDQPVIDAWQPLLRSIGYWGPYVRFV